MRIVNEQDKIALIDALASRCQQHKETVYDVAVELVTDVANDGESYWRAKLTDVVDNMKITEALLKQARELEIQSSPTTITDEEY